MTDAATRKLQEAYDALVAGFLAPLVSGDGVASLSRPVGPGALDYFSRTRCGSAEADSRLFDALHRLGSEIAPLETVPWAGEPEARRGLVAIGMILHDLLFLTDPSLDRLFARGARSVVLGWIDRLLEQIPAPSTRGDALARHAMLTAFGAVQRRDTVVKNWAYTYRFFGRPVPGNVTALPKLRFVREQHTTIDVLPLLAKLDAEHDLGLAGRFRQLVARSPVTELCRPDRHAPLRFGLASLRVLADPSLRGGIARQIAAAGEWACAPALGAAISDPTLASAHPALLGPALQLLLEVHLTAALDARLASTVPAGLDAASARYAAILPAWLEDPLALDEIRALDDSDRATLQKRAERMRRAVPEEVLKESVALVSRARTVMIHAHGVPSAAQIEVSS